MTATLTPQDFVACWRQATLKERSAAQAHFIDLCRLLGHPTPAEADPAGKWYAFEMGASKTGGGQGWADVCKQGCFAWEYKGKHGDLDKAYRQLLLYAEALLNPPLLVVSDIETIRIHTHFNNSVKRVYTLTLDDLLKPESLELLRRVFTDPEALRDPRTAADVTQDAARQFAHLAELLRKYGADPHAAAHFLIRLLFCLFAEDVGILPHEIFSRLVRKPHRTVTAFTDQLRQLFAAMSTGGTFGLEDIPHVDGGLFDDDVTLDLGSDGLKILADVSSLDWSSVAPSIFGTLFERSLDPDKRSQLGAHFTGEDDIRLVVEPVLMAPLRRRWAEVRKHALRLAEKRGVTALAQPSAQRTRQLAKMSAEIFGGLRAFRDELAGVQVLDAACGSGNFLYVALRLLLDLEKEVINLAAQLGDSISFPVVDPVQLHGIEINPYAYELAQTTIWIGYIQWLRENGFGLPAEPILKPLDAIRQMDAILAAGDRGQESGIREPEWPAADVIIGNPPFLGGKRLRSELGDEYVDALFRLYDGRVPREADLVCYWFEKARAQLAAGKAKRVGLLATQAIRAGANRRVLQRIKDGGDIFMAWSDRSWVLDGASVRVSMVGFDGGAEKERVLDGKSVPEIHADLSGALDLTGSHRLGENAGICYQGPVKVGPFEIEADIASQMVHAPNLHGQPNTDVVRPWLNASDVTGRSRGMYIIDFGLMTIEEACLYEAPFEYVRRVVKPLRESNNDPQRKSHWWRLGRSGRDLKAAVETKRRMILTPRVAKHRLFVFESAKTVPDSRLFAFGRDDDYFLGVLHSRIHEVWSLATSSRHGVGNDPTYNNTTCFETFPFPWPPGQEPVDDPRVQAIAAAAADLVAKRDAWISPLLPSPERSSAQERGQGVRSLTALYNARPAWLDLAHRRLDTAVLAAYGWPSDLGDEEILARLLALNGERAQKER